MQLGDTKEYLQLQYQSYDPMTNAASCMPHWSVWCSIPVVRFLVITNFIITITRFYFWKIVFHTVTILHTRWIIKVVRLPQCALFLTKFVNKIFSSYSWWNWCDYSICKDLMPITCSAHLTNHFKQTGVFLSSETPRALLVQGLLWSG
jgi:hypothetical protein